MVAPSDWFVRDPNVVAVARGDSYLFVVPERDPFVLREVDVAGLARVFLLSATPVSGSALAAECTDETIQLLVDEGILLRGGEAELRARVDRLPRPPDKRPCARITVAITGTINSIRAHEIVLPIASRFADEVDVILTRSACRFVRPRLYEHFGMRTFTDPHATPRGVKVAHMHLASADLIVIAPASAATIARLASGACSDLVSLVVAATEAPVIVAPAMNVKMWRNPAVARNVAQLRADGIWVVEPRAGYALSDAEPTLGMGRIGFDASNVLGTLAAVLQERATAGFSSGSEPS